MSIIDVDSTLVEFNKKVNEVKESVAERIKDVFEHTIKFYWQETSSGRALSTIKQRESAAFGKKGKSYYHATDKSGEVWTDDIGLRWSDKLLNSMSVDIDLDEVVGKVTDPMANVKESGLIRAGHESFWDVFLKLFNDGLERYIREAIK